MNEVLGTRRPTECIECHGSFPLAHMLDLGAELYTAYNEDGPYTAKGKEHGYICNRCARELQAMHDEDIATGAHDARDREDEMRGW